MISKTRLLVLSGFLELSKRSLSDAAAMADFIAKEEKAAAAIARQISFTKDYEDLGVKSAVWQDVSALVSSTTHELPMQNIRIDNRCPGLEVFADPLLEKVFYNLIDNSLHYGGKKMTAIRITAEEQGRISGSSTTMTGMASVLMIKSSYSRKVLASIPVSASSSPARSFR